MMLSILPLMLWILLEFQHLYKLHTDFKLYHKLLFGIYICIEAS